MLAELSIFPTDKGESVSEYVAEVIGYIKSECSRKGMSYETNSMATIIEGESRDVWELIVGCHNLMGASSNRYYSVIKIDERKGKTNSIRDKPVKIEELLRKH